MKDFFGTRDFRGKWHSDKKIIYDQQPMESWQGMPAGTGKTGTVVWCDSSITLQVNSTDSWAADGSLPSLLRVCLNLTGDPFKTNRSYYQELDLKNAAIKIKVETEEGYIKAEIKAHPELDVIAVDLADRRKEPGIMKVVPYLHWRQDIKHFTRNGIIFHVESNIHSAFDELNRMSGVYEHGGDVLKGLSYGTALFVESDSYLELGGGKVVEKNASRRKRILIAAEAGKFDYEELAVRLEDKVRKALSLSRDEFDKSHGGWWKRFWSRSYFEIDPCSGLQPLSAVWHLNRYFAASSMRGIYPTKFNGSIFLFEHDMRSWGGPYWFQNTRLLYYPLFKTGDIDYMLPFFDMYCRALRYARKRVEAVYGHKGAVFMETMHSWGAGREGDTEEGKGVVNPYIKSHFSGSLELLFMMCEYYRYTEDTAFARDKLLPLAEDILDFFFNHFPLKNGKLFLERSAALETWWEADNPADQVAGLKSVIPAVIKVGENAGYSKSTILKWKDYLNYVPELPRGKMRVEDGVWLAPLTGNNFLPALDIHHLKKENFEDPELYALWPFSLLGIDLPGYTDILSTFRARIHKEPKWGWSQTAVWAARLGLAEEAAGLLLKQFEHSAVLPGGMMISPGGSYPGRNDLVPDCPYFDTMGVMAVSVNEMLLQDYTGDIRTFPAWPEAEKVSFKLHSASGIVSEQNR